MLRFNSDSDSSFPLHGSARILFKRCVPVQSWPIEPYFSTSGALRYYSKEAFFSVRIYGYDD